LGLLDCGPQITDRLLVSSPLGQDECGKEPLEDESNGEKYELQVGPGCFKTTLWHGEQEKASG
jgi:hypothetical protein